MVYLWNVSIICFYFFSSRVANKIEDYQRVLPCLPHLMNIVCSNCGDWWLPCLWVCWWCRPFPWRRGWCRWLVLMGEGVGVGGVEVGGSQVELMLGIIVLSDLILSTPDMTRRRLLTMDFLFACSTPPRCLLWLHHVVRSLVVRWSWEMRLTLPKNVSYCFMIYLLMSGILKTFLNVSFVMRCSFASAILLPSMNWMLWCRNNPSFLRKDVQIAQILQTNSNRFMGRERKMRYLLWLLTLVSVQNLVRTSISAFPSARHASMS